jgi:O-antigen/teichoic acid export membrane protein
MLVINIQAPTLLLGAIKGPQTAGLYAIATRGADLIGFGLISVNLALAPVAARLWAQRDLPQLQQMITKSVRAALIFTLPLAAVLIIFGGRFLSLFGPGFVEAKSALTILIIGQLMNVAMGSVGLLLIMTGHERQVVIVTVVCAFLNIALNLIMIPFWGVVGTALAVTISIIAWNIVLAICVKWRLGLHSTALGLR